MNTDVSEILNDIYLSVCSLCKTTTNDCIDCRFFKICTDVLDYLEDK